MISSFEDQPRQWQCPSLWPSGIGSRLGRKRLEFDSWQCRIYIPCSLSLRLLGSLRGSWVHMAWHKNCVEKSLFIWIVDVSFNTISTTVIFSAAPIEVNEHRLCYDAALQRDEWPWIGKTTLIICIPHYQGLTIVSPSMNSSSFFSYSRF